MKKYVSIVMIVVLLVLSCVFFAACNAKADNLIRLNEVTHSVFYAPLYVAINKGYFEEYGLEVELTNGGGADKSMTAVISGQADIGLMGPEAAVYVKAGGSNNYPIVFGQLTKRDGAFLVGRKAEPDFKWTDLAGKEIIGGRKGGMPAMSLEHALNKNGLAIGTDVVLNYDVQFDLITAAFEGGTGDYCTMFEPNASQYEALGKGYIITDVGSEAGEMPYTCFMATKDFIAKNSDKVTAFMKAIIKAVDFVTVGATEEIVDALVPSFPTTSRELLKKSVENYKAIDAYMSNPVMTKSAFDNMITVLKESKSLNGDVAFEEIIDNSIVEKIIAEK
ncbi:MAG: ABC transporter substrate-binding protein [Christensenellales bacterium]